MAALGRLDFEVLGALVRKQLTTEQPRESSAGIGQTKMRERARPIVPNEVSNAGAGTSTESGAFCIRMRPRNGGYALPLQRRLGCESQGLRQVEAVGFPHQPLEVGHSANRRLE